MIEIRRATIEDETEIFNLLGQLIPAESAPLHPVRSESGFNTFRKIISNEEKGTIIVAEEDNSMVGVITLSYPTAIRCGGTYALIEEFIVSETMRGKGVGGKLLATVIDEANSHNCYEIQVNRPSEMGYPLYIRYGWKDLGKHLNMSLSGKREEG